MPDNTTHDSIDGLDVETDDEAAPGAGRDHRDTDYLDREVNLLRPSTPFMRDHLRIIWTGFVVWAIVVFGPVTLTAVVPDVMTVTMPILGFPLHYFLVAIGAPVGALALAFWYARKRDELDEKYDIEHGTAATENRSGGEPEGVSADGGALE